MSEHYIFSDDNIKHNIEDTSAVHIFEDITEQEVIEEILKDNRIPYVIKSFKDSALNGIYQQSHGFSELFVYEHDKSKVQKILEDYKNQKIIEEDEVRDEE